MIETNGALLRQTRQSAESVAATRWSHSRLVSFAHSPFTMSNSPARSTSRSRDAFAPGVCKYFHPVRGGRSADRRPDAAASGWPAASHETHERLVSRGGPGRLRSAPRPSKSEGRAPLGAPSVAILGLGPRFHLGHCLPIRAASSSQPGRSAWRAGSPASRGKRLRAASRGTPLPAPPSGSSLEDAPH